MRARRIAAAAALFLSLLLLALPAARAQEVSGLAGLLREETERLLADKSYLESVYRAGAEKASRVAGRTLDKVYKKVGFLAR